MTCMRIFLGENVGEKRAATRLYQFVILYFILASFLFTSCQSRHGEWGSKIDVLLLLEKELI